MFCVVCKSGSQHVIQCPDYLVKDGGILAVRYKTCQPWSLDSGTILGYIWIWDACCTWVFYRRLFPLPILVGLFQEKDPGDRGLKPNSHRLAEKNVAAGDQDAFSKLLKPPDLPHFRAWKEYTAGWNAALPPRKKVPHVLSWFRFPKVSFVLWMPSRRRFWETDSSFSIVSAAIWSFELEAVM